MASHADVLRALTLLHKKLGQIGLAALLLNRHRPLSEFGFDSLDKIELLFELEERFNIEITDDALKSIRTVSDLLAYLETKGLPAPAGPLCD